MSDIIHQVGATLRQEVVMTDRRLVVASWLCIPMAVYAMVAPFAILLPSHAFDKTWPPHAKFHLFWASGKLLALGTGQLFLALFGLPSGKRWTWYAMVSNILFGGLSMIPASYIAHGPIPPFQLHDRSTKLVVITFLSAAIGLMFAMPSVFRSSTHRDRD